VEEIPPFYWNKSLNKKKEQNVTHGTFYYKKKQAIKR
jgi:hypothetical protein